MKDFVWLFRKCFLIKHHSFDVIALLSDLKINQYLNLFWILIGIIFLFPELIFFRSLDKIEILFALFGF